MTRESRIQRERQLLAALCLGARNGSLGEAARERLANYSWSDAAYLVVFEIVTSFPSAHGEPLREQLPARLTRRGFPDFDFAFLFAGPPAARAEVEGWIEQLSGPDS